MATDPTELPEGAPPDNAPPDKPDKKQTWDHISSRATTIASISSLFLFLLVVGGVGGYFLSQAHKSNNQTTKQPTIQNLSPEDIAKLNQVGSDLGSSGQTLNIGANALFRGNADVTGKLTVGGQFIANGPVLLSQLNITGNAAVNGLSIGSNLVVTGATTMQKSLTVGDNVTTNSLNASGVSNLNAVNAAAITVRNLTIAGPLTISHIATTGPTPTMAGGTALGAGGTTSISGNDTAGTINFNIGTSPPAGVLGTVSFRAGYTGTVHVLLTPITGPGAAAPAYVTRSASGFQVHIDTIPPSGTLSYDYLVTQ